MSNGFKILLKITLAIILAFLTCLVAVYAQEEQVVDRIREVYLKLADAEESGADVRGAALKLNKALELVRRAEEGLGDRDLLLSQAGRIVGEVESEIPMLIADGPTRAFWNTASIVIGVVSLGAVVGYVYLYGSKIFWRTWLKLRRGWKVKVLRSISRSEQ